MDINDLTIGQAKELAELLYAEPQKQQSGIGARMIGKYVIARCYAAGVHAGTVLAVDGDEVVLTGARRLWSWKAVDGIALSGVAVHGIKPSSKVDSKVGEIYLTGVCELIPCSELSRESIDAA